MNHSPSEPPPHAPLRRLLLRLTAPETSEESAVPFDPENIAATLKRAAVAAVTLLPPVRPVPPASSNADFESELAAACGRHGVAVEAATETEVGVSLHTLANRPATEAACYSRLCRGQAILLEDALAAAGTLDAEAYRLLGSVFGDLVLKEPWYRNATPQIELGILISATSTESRVGAARLVQAGGHAFDLLNTSTDFTPYRLLVLPEDVTLNAALQAKLQTYLQQGGKLLASHEAEEDTEGLRFLRAEAVGSGTAGNGNIVLLSEPPFRAYTQRAGTRHRRAVLDALKSLLPDPVLWHDGPSTMEAVATEQAEQNRWVVHLMHYLPMGIALDSPIRDEVLPVHEVKVSLKTPKRVTRVTMRPQHHDELDFWEYNGRVEFVVPKIMGYRMVSIEFAE